MRTTTCKIQMSGEDEATIMSAIHEITQKLSAWLCHMCGRYCWLRLSMSLRSPVRVMLDSTRKSFPKRWFLRIFSAASAILIPYTESVGASGPIHSYAGYGVPIVAADVGYHLRESIGGNVLLFKTSDSKSLAKRLEEILSDDNLATRLGQSQVSYAKKENWRRAANRTVEYYKRALKI